jgi:hypothetical protein
VVVVSQSMLVPFQLAVAMVSEYVTNQTIRYSLSSSSSYAMRCFVDDKLSSFASSIALPQIKSVRDTEEVKTQFVERAIGSLHEELEGPTELETLHFDANLKLDVCGLR